MIQLKGFKIWLTINIKLCPVVSCNDENKTQLHNFKDLDTKIFNLIRFAKIKYKLILNIEYN